MERVRLYDKTFKTFIPHERIMEAIDRTAAKINEDFRGCTDNPVLLCVLNGSIMFTAELMQRLEFNCELVSTKLTSYQGTGSTGKVKQAMGLTADIAGKRVIIVEDIVDTGNTIVELKKYLPATGQPNLRCVPSSSSRTHTRKTSPSTMWRWRSQMTSSSASVLTTTNWAGI